MGIADSVAARCGSGGWLPTGGCGRAERSCRSARAPGGSLRSAPGWLDPSGLGPGGRRRLWRCAVRPGSLAACPGGWWSGGDVVSACLVWRRLEMEDMD